MPKAGADCCRFLCLEPDFRSHPKKWRLRNTDSMYSGDQILRIYITVLGSCFDKVPPLLFYGPLHGAGGLFAMQIPLRNPCHLHTNNLAVYKLEPTKNNLQTQNKHSLTPVLRSRSRWNQNYFGTWSQSRK